jgi:D-lactate dehydrogenase (cytochrome)
VAPDLVAFPESNEDVAGCVRACRALGVPLVGFGKGTSLEGGVAALGGGLCLDLGRGMARVLEVRPEEQTARVQAGTTRLQLERHLRGSGLFFPVDPGADASLGGMVSTRASGTAAVKYGTMRDRVAGLTVCLASGELVRTGAGVAKSSAGLDLTALFCGAEGTLGVVCEVQLKLAPVPEAVSAAVVSFPSLDQAVGAVVDLKAFGAGVAR